MRIISRHKDYYDGLQNHNRKDRFNRVYLRTPLEIAVRLEKISELHNRHIYFRAINWDSKFMIIAGKVIPFIAHEVKAEWTGKKYIDGHYNSYFNAEDAYTAYIGDKDRNDLNTRYWWRGRVPKMKDFVDFFRDYADMTNLCIERDTPIILVEPGHPHYEFGADHVRNAHMNVNLKKYGFSKLYTSHDIYQTIDVFMSNVLINDDMPTTPMTEKQKMNQHGFDDTYGFRTRKKK